MTLGLAANARGRAWMMRALVERAGEARSISRSRRGFAAARSRVGC
ncbi:Hypothetical protein A7982_10013 [Minicystis rosea]|nr:Hypothetical protein A7982_10013 [Minicystis rosea]